MAFTKEIAKEMYKDLPIDELKKEYEIAKKNYSFIFKKDFIKYTVDNYLNSSISANDEANIKALEELLKEKTGDDYSVTKNAYIIYLEDIINYVADPKIDPFWTEALYNYFNKLDMITEDAKIDFLIGLYQNKQLFNEFTRDIIKPIDCFDIYCKYRKLVKDYLMENMKEC